MGLDRCRLDRFFRYYLVTLNVKFFKLFPHEKKILYPFCDFIFVIYEKALPGNDLYDLLGWIIKPLIKTLSGPMRWTDE